MDRTAQSLERKLSAWMLGLGEDGAGIKLHVQDAGEHGARELVREFALTADRAAQTLALEIVHAATEYASGLGNGVHRFAVRLYVGRETASSGSHPFQIVTEDAVDDQQEEASARTLLGQTQRHLEVAMKTNQAMLTSVTLGLGSIIAQLQDQNSAYQTMSMGMLQTMRELAVARGQLEVDAETRKLHMQMAATAFTEIAPPLLKQLVAKIGGEEKPEPVPGPVQTVVRIVDREPDPPKEIADSKPAKRGRK